METSRREWKCLLFYAHESSRMKPAAFNIGTIIELIRSHRLHHPCVEWDVAGVAKGKERREGWRQLQTQIYFSPLR